MSRSGRTSFCVDLRRIPEPQGEVARLGPPDAAADLVGGEPRDVLEVAAVQVRRRSGSAHLFQPADARGRSSSAARRCPPAALPSARPARRRCRSWSGPSTAAGSGRRSRSSSTRRCTSRSAEAVEVPLRMASRCAGRLLLCASRSTAPGSRRCGPRCCRAGRRCRAGVAVVDEVLDGRGRGPSFSPASRRAMTHSAVVPTRKASWEPGTTSRSRSRASRCPCPRSRRAFCDFTRNATPSVTACDDASAAAYGPARRCVASCAR